EELMKPHAVHAADARRWLPWLKANCASVVARDRRCALHGQYDRDLPQGQADCQPHALAHRAQAHDDSGAHAVEPSTLRRMDTGTPVARGREDRSRDDRAVRGDHEGEAASRAGLPLMPGHPQPGEELWTGTHRGGSQARQRYTCDYLRLDQVDPAER